MKLARRLKSQEKSGIFFSPELDPKENTSSNHSLLTQELDEREIWSTFNTLTMRGNRYGLRHQLAQFLDSRLQTHHLLLFHCHLQSDVIKKGNFNSFNLWLHLKINYIVQTTCWMCNSNMYFLFNRKKKKKTKKKAWTKEAYPRI